MEIKPTSTKRAPRKKSKLEIFKEEKLPMIIAAVTAVIILIFIIGSISNAVKRNRLDKEQRDQATLAAQERQEKLDADVSKLLKQADVAAMQYDYDKALDILAPVAKHADKYPALKKALDTYSAAKDQLIPWDDPALIPNLSFHMLIADSGRAFSNSQNGSSLSSNYVTTAEFTAIINQLYNNGYVLVGLYDIYNCVPIEDGVVSYQANTIYLPEGKKPIMITQTNVNYGSDLIDSDNDGIPDKDGCGFASKLLIQDNKPVNEMVDRDGNTVIGEYDLIPILDAFIESHPDFSYHGSKALIAMTGYDGLFGYRTNNPDSPTYQNDINQASAVAQWLRDHGYTLACYTYGNIPYGGTSISDIRADMKQWHTEVTPILGETDVLVYAKESDIAANGEYAGAKFEILVEEGFRYYLGFCEEGELWSKATPHYVRQARIMVTGSSLAYKSSWFGGMFDINTVLDPARGSIPTG